MNITERFFKYVGSGTNRDEKSETCPSTPNQLVLGVEGQVSLFSSLLVP